MLTYKDFKRISKRITLNSRYEHKFALPLRKYMEKVSVNVMNTKTDNSKLHIYYKLCANDLMNAQGLIAHGDEGIRRIEIVFYPYLFLCLYTIFFYKNLALHEFSNVAIIKHLALSNVKVSLFGVAIMLYEYAHFKINLRKNKLSYFKRNIKSEMRKYRSLRKNKNRFNIKLPIEIDFHDDYFSVIKIQKKQVIKIDSDKDKDIKDDDHIDKDNKNQINEDNNDCIDKDNKDQINEDNNDYIDKDDKDQIEEDNDDPKEEIKPTQETVFYYQHNLVLENEDYIYIKENKIQTPFNTKNLVIIDKHQIDSDDLETLYSIIDDKFNRMKMK